MLLSSRRPWIATAIVASVAAIVSGIHAQVPVWSWLAAGLFATALVAAAIDVNWPWWTVQNDEVASEDAVAACLRNSRLIALAYLWGSIALVVIYRFTGLQWQHGLQYAAAMALISWLIMVYVYSLARPASSLRSPRALAMAAWLSLAHGAAALAGIVFLIASGKIFSVKGDWAANQIFLSGGLAITALSLISAYTQLKIGQGQPRQRRAEPAAGE